LAEGRYHSGADALLRPDEDSIERRQEVYTPKLRPSGHDISTAFDKDNGGAIPPNLLQIPNTGSMSDFMGRCKEHGLERHRARFPEALPRFFIQFLSSPGDLVVDIFSGPNATGWVAECLNRQWVAIEVNRDYAIGSSLRFMVNWEGGTS
jgi:DNA modification methylase